MRDSPGTEPIPPASIVTEVRSRASRQPGRGQDGSAQNVADFSWSRLHEWGARCVFGYPGDGINGLLGDLQQLGEDKIRFIQVRHEEMAAFMASSVCVISVSRARGAV